MADISQYSLVLNGIWSSMFHRGILYQFTDWYIKYQSYQPVKYVIDNIAASSVECELDNSWPMSFQATFSWITNGSTKFGCRKQGHLKYKTKCVYGLFHPIPIVISRLRDKSLREHFKSNIQLKKNVYSYREHHNNDFNRIFSVCLVPLLSRVMK